MNDLREHSIVHDQAHVLILHAHFFLFLFLFLLLFCAVCGLLAVRYQNSGAVTGCLTVVNVRAREAY